MKKLLSLILSCLMLLSLTITTFAEGNEIKRDASWQISATDNYGGAGPKLAFDGNAETMYHSYYAVNPDGTMSYERNNHAITVDFGKTITVSGFTYQARTDNKSGVMTEFAVYASTDGVNFAEIHTGSFDYGEGYTDTSIKTASWGNMEIRAIKLVSVKGYAGHFTAPEITFLEGTSGTKNGSGKAYVTTGAESKEKEEKAAESVNLDSVGGSILEKEASWAFSESDKHGNLGANLAFDGNPKTYYHSFYEVTEGGMNWQKNGHSITVDFGKTTKVSGWVYQRRTDDKSGTISKYEIYTSDNGTDFEKIYTGAFYYGKDYSDMSAKIGSWGDTETRYIKIVSVEGYAGHATAAEISFITGSKRVEESVAEEAIQEEFYTAKSGVKSVSRKGWKASVNSELNSSPIGNILDGDNKSHWHSWYQASGSSITKKDSLPYEIELILPREETISGMVFIPRQDNQSGRFILTDIYVADSDDGEYFLLVKDYKTETNPAANELLFNSNVKVKKIKIEVVSSYATYGTLAEFYAIGRNDNFETVEYKDFEEYEKKNKFYPIKQSEILMTSENKVWEPHAISLAKDGNNETFWQTESVTSGTNIFIRADLGRVNRFSKISYLPRQTNDYHGLWKKVSIWVSEDGEAWDCAIADYSLEKSLGEHFIELKEPVSARYVDFEITEYEANRASCAELNFWQDYEAYLEFGKEKDEKYELKIDSNIIKVTHGDTVTEKAIDVAPYIVNGSTLIPLRGLLEEMGATVSWDGETQTVTITKDNTKIELQIWSKMVYIEDGVYERVRHTMLNFPVIKDSRTFIPVRFVSEMLGYNVAWDGATQTITITK